MVLKFYLDDREQSQAVKDAFQFVAATRVFDYEIAHLDIGDVVCGNVCIERKEATDFICSIMDGRLKEQARKMHLGYEYRYVIIEGSPYQTGSAINDNAIIGKMTSLLVKHGIRLLYVENELQFAEACYSLVKKHMEENIFDGSYVPVDIPKKNEEEILAMMLMQIPGVSYAKGQQIAELYDNSIYKFVNNAIPGQLTTLDGIGKKTAQKICEIIKK